MENQKRSFIMMFLISMRAVMWGFLGVRKRSGQDADMASVTFVHIVLAGILGAIIFMTILLLIVKAVVSN
jgi:small-conductance mechanosensitive channel